MTLCLDSKSMLVFYFIVINFINTYLKEFQRRSVLGDRGNLCHTTKLRVHLWAKGFGDCEGQGSANDILPHRKGASGRQQPGVLDHGNRPRGRRGRGSGERPTGASLRGTRANNNKDGLRALVTPFLLGVVEIKEP